MPNSPRWAGSRTAAVDSGAGTSAAATSATRWQRNRQQPLRQVPWLALPLIILLLLLIYLLTWFSPVPLPKVMVLTAQYEATDLPPNAAAIRDTQELLAHSEMLQVGQASSASQNQATLQATIETIRNIRVRNWWLEQPASLFVYVNTQWLVVEEAADSDADAVALAEEQRASKASSAGSAGAGGDPQAGYVTAPGSGAAAPAPPRGSSLPLLTRRVARLVPDNATTPSDQVAAWPTVRDLLVALADNPAPWKILVLDGGQIGPQPMLGGIDGDFVAAVRQELDRLRPAQRRGLFVLFAAEAGQPAWTDWSTGRTVFGTAFVQGLIGLADSPEFGGDNNGRISLAELYAYIRKNVEAWSLQQRGEVQRPLLLSFGQDPARVEVLAVAAGAERVRPTNPLPIPSAAQLADMQREWMAWRRLLAEPRHPSTYAPAEWVAYRNSLRQAEIQWLGGAGEAVDGALAACAVWRQATERARERSTFGLLGTSLPNLALTGQGEWADLATQRRRTLERWLEKPAEAESYVALQTALAWPATAPMPSPTELRLFRRIADEVLTPAADLGETERVARALAAAEIVRTALRAEEAATAAGLDSGLLVDWFADSMAQADLHRRLAEDRLFAHALPTVAVGGATDNAAPGPPAEEQYLRLRTQATQLADAWRLVRLLNTEMPDWLRFAASLESVRRRALPEPTASATWKPAQLLDAVGEMVGQHVRLSMALESPPKSAAERDESLLLIAAEATALREVRRRLVAAILAERDLLARDEVAATAPEQWHRLDTILTAPEFADAPVADDPTSAPSAEAAAEQRTIILSRLRLPVKAGGASATFLSGGDGQAAGDEPSMAAPGSAPGLLGGLHAQVLAMLADPTTNSPRGAELASARPAAIADQWRDWHSRLIGPPLSGPSVLALTRASTAEILLAGHFGPPSRARYAEVLRQYYCSRFCAAQAARRTEDFYGASAADSGSEPYYRRAALHLLDFARAAHVGTSMPWVMQVQQRLEELANVRPSLEVQPSNLSLFSFGDPMPISLRPTALSFLPQGWAGVAVTDPQAAISATPVPRGEPAAAPANQPAQERAAGERAKENDFGSGPDALRFRVTPAIRGGETVAQVALRFRGHVFATPLPVRIYDDEDAPALVYRHQIPPTAELVARSAATIAGNTEILLVLDCSGSMASQNQRFEQMRQLLTAFADRLTPGGIRVGLRVFGTEVAWQRGDAAETEQRAKLDTRLVQAIQPFDPATFKAAVQGLRARGSSPIFRALLAARGDFADRPDATQIVVLVSDGGDNWSAQEGSPGLAELQDAYQGSGIRVACVGFMGPESDFGQLASIAELAGRGQAVTVERGAELLDRLAGLEAPPLCRLRSATQNNAIVQEFPFAATNPPLTLTPDVFRVEAVKEGKVIDTLEGFRLRAGQRQFLYWREGRLERQLPDLPPVIATVDQAGVRLAVFEATPVGAQAETHARIRVRLGLYAPGQPDWWPTHTRLWVRPWGSEQEYLLPDLPPNLAGWSIPAWEFELEQWPADIRLAQIEARWDGPSDPPTPLPTLEWGKAWAAGSPAPGAAGSAGSVALPLGTQVYFRAPGPEIVEDRRLLIGTAKVAFPANQPPQVGQWLLRPTGAVEYARLVFNQDQRVLIGHFAQKAEVPPIAVHLAPAAGADRNVLITDTFPVSIPALRTR